MTKEQFIDNAEEFSNHRHILWLALELTKGNEYPVCEFGSGLGSTPYLRKYCSDNHRQFITYESNQEWAEKCGSVLIQDWSAADIYKRYSVVLIDHAPGEHRHEAAAILKDKADIVVIHDSELHGAGNYQYEKIWRLFNYKLHIEINGTGATMLSNKINIANEIL